jgi:hypothetical protein
VVEPQKQTLLVELAPSVALRGIVTVAGVACEGARVKWLSDSDGVKAEAVTNKEGKFELTHLVAGWGEIMAIKEQGGGCWVSRARLLCRDGVEQDIQLIPAEGSRILVCDASENALGGWRVLVLEDGSAESYVTDGRGAIQSRPGASARRVAVYAPFGSGWEALPRVVQLLGDSRKVVVPSASDSPGSLSGSVMELRGGKLLASRDEEAWPEKVTIEVDAGGRFRLDGIPPGPVVFWHVKDGFCYRLQACRMASGAVQETSLLLSK